MCCMKNLGLPEMKTQTSCFLANRMVEIPRYLNLTLGQYCWTRRDFLSLIFLIRWRIIYESCKRNLVFSSDRFHVVWYKQLIQFLGVMIGSTFGCWISQQLLPGEYRNKDKKTLLSLQTRKNTYLSIRSTRIRGRPSLQRKHRNLLVCSWIVLSRNTFRLLLCRHSDQNIYLITGVRTVGRTWATLKEKRRPAIFLQMRV